ncbi:MAG: sulfite oxidase-like oxidoreductase [Ignavibacteriae bacterium]|nr:sulfite oxidase-like oxidoreductase [Ignavibacteriota bacterium]
MHINQDKIMKERIQKLPPGQVLTKKFPIYTYDETPIVEQKDWKLRVWGEVEEERVFSWEEFMQLPQTTIRADFHCVTRWSRFDDDWTGVLFKDFVQFIKLKPTAKFIMQHTYDNYTTNLPIEVMLDEEVMFAHTFNGEPLPREHGGPMRIFTPKRYAWKGAKWINEIEFMQFDKPGLWERNGYNTPADPWKEERFG